MSERQPQAVARPNLTPLVVGARELVPIPAANSIARPGLDQLLDASWDHPVTVISAGPGWGKTTGVSRWLASTDPPGDFSVAWLTLGPGSDDPASFWNGVLRGIEASGAVPERHPLSALSPGDGVTDEVLLMLHRGLGSLPGRVLLVLDDFHVIEDPVVLDQFARVISHRSRLSVILLSRIQPVLPLHQLRLTGDLLELTSRDLAFSAEEVTAMARTQGLDLAEQDTEAVLERTQGWPAGVRLATLYLSRTGNSGGIGSFAGTERSVTEYLLAEVLERNTPATRDFLLRTSVCDPISADLAAAIVPGHSAQASLEMHEHRNEFVTALGADRVWFRYHPLLRDLLEHTLRRDHPDTYLDAHRAAATWLASHGDPMTALEHAAAADDWALFAEILAAAAAPSLVGTAQTRLRALLSDVPYADLPEGVDVDLMRAALGYATNNPHAIQVNVDRAQARVRNAPAPLPAATVALLELFIATVGWLVGDTEGVIRAYRAVNTALDAADPFPAAQVYRAIADINLGLAQFWSGDITGAQTTVPASLDRASTRDVGLIDLLARGTLAHADLLHAQLDSAGEGASELRTLASARGWTTRSHARPAHVTQAWVRLLRGDSTGAYSALTAALATVPQLLIGAPTTLEALVAVSLGRPEAAQRAAERAVELARVWPQPAFLDDQLALMLADVAVLTGDHELMASTLAAARDSPPRAASRARLLLATGDVPGARELAGTVTEAGNCDTLVDLVALVDSWLVHVLAADGAGQALDATHALRRAVEIASPHYLVRPFLVTGSARMPVLLRRLADGQIRRDPFLVDLVDRTSTPARVSAEPAPLTEPLTGRELTMLAELPTMKSNAEIAAELFVSVNTVKAHLKGLYRKLDVDNRRAAVHRARDLGLLT